MDRRTFLQMAMIAPVLGQAARPSVKPSSSGLASTRWGGPYGNFHTDATGIKNTWPSSGPPVVWKRALGEGYSSPSVEGDVLYTMYGRGLPSRGPEGAKAGEEVVIAASVATGKTLWEHATPMAFVSDAAREQGNGPYADGRRGDCRQSTQRRSAMVGAVQGGLFNRHLHAALRPR
jgi:hypothetical protein